MKLSKAFALALFAGAAAAAQAEVVDQSPQGFTVQHEVMVKADGAAAWRKFVQDIGSWWNPGHTYSRNAHNLSIDARPGGCFCEALANGGGVQHLTVAFVAPGQTLRLVGGLGPFQGTGVAGSMTISFTAKGAETRVQLTYAVGGYWRGGFGEMPKAADAMLREQITRYQSFVDTGAPEAK